MLPKGSYLTSWKNASDKTTDGSRPVSEHVFLSLFLKKTPCADFSKHVNSTISFEDSSLFTFTGKELDAETGFSYFGARYLDHTLTTSWLSVDPMANKYPSISPYAYCAWNPVNLVDPNGSDTIKVYLDNGTIEQIKTTGDHSIMYFKKGELIDSDLIKKDKCSFRTNTYDLYNIENELGKICQNEHLLCSDIKTGEQIFKKIAKIGSSVEWDYYSMKNNYGDLSSSGLADNTIHVKDEYTASTVCFWDHYHPTISSDSFYPSHLDQDHARQLKGARCTIFSDGLSMDFNNHVPSNKNMYISLTDFSQLWYRFAK